MSRVAFFFFRDASPACCFFVPSIAIAMVIPRASSVAACFFSGLSVILAVLEGAMLFYGKTVMKEVFSKSRILSHYLTWLCAGLCLLLSVELALTGFWLLGSWVLTCSLHYLIEYYFCCSLSDALRKNVRYISSIFRLAYIGLSILFCLFCRLEALS